MEEVLDLYAEPYDPQRPVVCFDESSTQLLADVREPLPTKPGRPKRQDYEYVRAGTRNLFLACEPKAGWRHVAITQRRTMQDFAQQMRWLVDEAYPDVPVIRLVLDNLNTHRTASLYEAFPLRKHAASPNGWSSTTRPSTAVGSIWRRSSSVSSPAVASGSVSPTRNLSTARSKPWNWNWNGTKLKPASTGA